MKKIYQNTEKKEYVTPELKEYENKFSTRVLAGSEETIIIEEGEEGSMGAKMFTFEDEGV